MMNTFLYNLIKRLCKKLFRAKYLVNRHKTNDFIGAFVTSVGDVCPWGPGNASIHRPDVFLSLGIRVKICFFFLRDVSKSDLDGSVAFGKCRSIRLQGTICPQTVARSPSACVLATTSQLALKHAAHIWY